MLHGLGHTVPGAIDALIEHYEAPKHFITYPGEVNASISTNCNVLMILLLESDRNNHVPQIAKIMEYLVGSIYKGQGREKWVSQDLQEIEKHSGPLLTTSVTSSI